MNHDPGPSTTQSASWIAFSASGLTGGSGGSRSIAAITPSVVATSTWPRTVVSLSGSSSRPRTSARMSIGVRAIGSTRPLAPSSRPTQSRASTWSPSSSHSPTISRLPTTWPRISPSPAKRCWSTRAQVSPHWSSPHSAASAIRRSPGGSTPNSPRSRPRRPAVVGDRDDRGQLVDGEVVDQPAQRRQRGVQAVAAAERHHRLCAVAPHVTPGPGRGAPPGPRARGRPAAGRSPPTSRRCGACRRCSRSRPA